MITVVERTFQPARRTTCGDRIQEKKLSVRTLSILCRVTPSAQAELSPHYTLAGTCGL